MLKQSPSDYMREKGLSLPDGLRNFGYRVVSPQIIALSTGGQDDNTAVGAGGSSLKSSSIPMDRPLFQPFPSNIILQSFQPFQTYQVLVQFRNMDKVARKIRIEEINSPYFQVVGVKTHALQSGKVAAGMEFPIHIKFTPEENIDYSCNIICCTEREKFILPVQAIGARASLDFPDVVQFDRVPVKFATTKTILVRNVGTRDAKFTLSTKGPFSIEPAQGFLPVGKNMQVHVTFEADNANEFDEECVIHYDTGELVFIRLLATSEDVNIRLERIAVDFEPSSVTLSSFKVIRIHNRSNIMAKYSWRSLPNREAEEAHLARTLQELKGQEEAELVRFRRDLEADPTKLAFETASTQQSYKNARLALRKNTYAFENNTFSIEPLSGCVWPDNVAEFKAFFKPLVAGTHSVTAYCDVAGRASRLPLTLKGEAFGPATRFSFDILDISDVFINTLHRYELLIENHSDILVQYAIREPTSTFGSKFKFFPTKGIVPEGQSQSITISFESDILGEFDEEILFDIQGQTNPMPLRLMGRIQGPAFHFDREALDFGPVAFGFTHTQPLHLFNDCEIPMEYRIRIINFLDGKEWSVEGGKESDFLVCHAQGFIPPNASQPLEVQFTPRSVSVHSLRFCVDILGVQNDMKWLKISAAVIVPEIQVQSTKLEMGDCFLNHAYSGEILLSNPSEFPARYCLQAQEKDAKMVYSYDSPNGLGIIHPQSTVSLQIIVETKRLALVNFPVFVIINGMEDVPQAVDIVMNGVGPQVKFSATEINWGRINVLETADSTITLFNSSPVAAAFSCDLGDDSGSVFSVSPRSGSIPPHNEIELTFSAFCDDCIKFDSIARIYVADDHVHEVRLVARGVGSTVTCDKDIARIPFGRVFCDTLCQFKFTLHNRGRRTQHLAFVLENPARVVGNARKLVYSRSAPARTGLGMGHESFVFSVSPMRFTMKPNAKEEITFRGRHASPFNVNETIVCLVNSLESENNMIKIMETDVSAEFVLPTIITSAPDNSLQFEKIFSTHTPFETIVRDFSFTNVSSLALDVTLSCTHPYSVQGELNKSVHMKPGESYATSIHLDTMHNADRISRNTKSALAITYQQHSQRDEIQLFSSLQFPNVSLSKSAIDFGYISNDTWAKKAFTMTNCGKVPVPFQWSFYKAHRNSPSSPGDNGSIPVNQIFDIIPMRGIVDPGTTETVVVSFFGQSNGVYDVTAALDTNGGPTYDLQLHGKASHVAYELPENSLDYGLMHYQSIITKDLILHNLGLVDVRYVAFFPRDSTLLDRIVVNPATAVVPAGSSFAIQVSFCPLLPESVEDYFLVQVDNGKPEKIQISAVGTSPELSINVPVTTPVSNFIFDSASGGERLRSPKPSATTSTAVTPDNPKIMTDPRAIFDAFRRKTKIFLETLIRSQPVETDAVENKIGSALIMHKVYSKKEARRKSAISELSSITMTEYDCSCSNVVAGTQARKQLTISNLSKGPVTIIIDKTIWNNTGFFVELERGIKIIPRGESTELVYGYQGKPERDSVAELKIPLQIVGGPTTILNMKAGVCLPIFQFSSSTVEFGEVLLGLRKTIPISLYNPYKVPCEWSTRPPVDPLQPRKPLKGLPKDIEIIPELGILQPHERITVLIRLCPSAAKVYDTLIPFNIAQNPKVINLTLKGRGVKPEIRLEPAKLQFDSVIPFTEWVEKKVTLYNPTAFPIEVYSVECDRKHLEEEQWLREQSGYNRGLLYLPPRDCGIPLGSEPTHNLSDKDTNLISPSSPTNGTIRRFSLAASMAGKANAENVVKHLLKHAAHSLTNESSVSEPSFVNIIIHGAPLAGKTTQAKLLAKKYGIPVISAEDVLKLHPETTAFTENRVLETGEMSTLQTPGDGKHTVLEDDPASSKEVTREPARELHSTNEESISEILKHRFEQEDCAKGFILDGVLGKNSPKYTDLVAAVIDNARAHKKKVAFVHLQLDFSQIRERELRYIKSVLRAELATLKVRNISEDEYAALTTDEKASFDHCTLEYKKRYKEIQDAIRHYKRCVEEEASQRVGQSNLEDEVKGRGKHKKKDTKPKDGKASVNNKQEKSAPPPVKKPIGTPSGAHTVNTNTKSHKDKKGDKPPSQGQDPSDSYTSLFAEGAGLDFFQSSEIIRKYEQYVSCSDVLISELNALSSDKDKQAFVSDNGSKKIGKVGLLSKGSAFLTSEAVLETSEPETAGNTEEISPFVIMRDLKASSKEDVILSELAEMFYRMDVLFPATIKSAGKDVLPPFFMEQAFTFPLERESRPLSKKFIIVTGQMQANQEGNSAYVDDTINPLPVLEKEKHTLNSSKKPVKPTRHTQEEIKQNEAEAEKAAERDAAAAIAASSYRWVIAPYSSKDLVIRFSSEEVGNFSHDFSFEIAGFKGEFNLPIVGFCSYPSFSTDYKTIFAKNWRKTGVTFADTKNNVSGKPSSADEATTILKLPILPGFSVDSNTFEFGALSCFKVKDKYAERYPENKGVFNIKNTSNSEIHISCSFLKSEPFFVEHTSISVPAGHTQSISVWAYPKTSGIFEDFLVICVRDNPQPVCIKYSCIGVKPELEPDRKQVVFDKVLVGKIDKREIRIKNITLLPLSWKLAGLETTVDEFTFSLLEGKLDPGAENVVEVEFKAIKSATLKRQFRIELIDSDKTGFSMPDYPIIIVAEAHEVLLDIHYPRGHEGGLEFGSIKVSEDQRQTITIKNKGRYEIGYRIIMDSKDLTELFTFLPAQGVIFPSDKLTNIQCLFKANREVITKDNNHCKFEFFDTANNTLYSTQSIRLSAIASFAKFTLFPVRDLNFGVVINGVKTVKQFAIENNGDFDFKYSICRTGAVIKADDVKTAKHAVDAFLSVAKTNITKEIRKQDGGVFGVFSISPTSGNIPAHSKQIINVEFHPEVPDLFEECIALDITDRPPESSEPVEYRLIGESCVTGINTNDLSSIFEEHLVVKRLEGHHNLNGSNFYAEEDRVFFFGAHHVGKVAQARFKISNTFKIPCEVVVSVRPKSKVAATNTKSNETSEFAFDVEPKKIVLPSHEYRYVTVTFNPQSLQSYSGIFECTTDGAVTGVEATKSKVLTFDLRGEGAIPHVSVVSPLTKGKSNQTLLKFRRLMSGQVQSLVAIFKNDGIVNCTFSLEWIYKDEFFQSNGLNQSYTLSPQESKTIEFFCKPNAIRKAEAEVRVWVLDNHFEEGTLLLSGEGYIDELSFELPGEEEAQLRLTDCFVNVERQAKFAVKSYSAETTRITFADENQHDSPITFSPNILHLKPGSRKTIIATWYPKTPSELKAMSIPVKMIRIHLSNKDINNQIGTAINEWDDKLKLVKWLTDFDGKSKQIAENVPEPAYESAGMPQKTFNLVVSGVADYSSYECDLKVAMFKKTFMYQSRSLSFTLKNTGAVALKYDFSFQDPARTENKTFEYDIELPFTVTPDCGLIPVGESQKIIIRFQPQEVVDLKVDLVGNIYNLKEAKPLVIPVHGYSQRPYCHFELDSTGFNLRSEEDIWHKSDLNPDAKFIEFTSCGIKVRNTKRFYIVNPTSEAYTFEWDLITEAASLHDKSFKCLTPKGTIEPGKKFELVFEFTPASTAIFETQWTFLIPQHRIKVPFYLLGKAFEPNVYIDKASVNFKPVIVSKMMKEVVNIVNEERIPFSFSFTDIPSEVGASGVPVVKASPLQGVVGPHSSLPIEFTLTPGAEKLYNINLACVVKKKPNPLQMNIKGEGYEIHDQIFCEQEDGTSILELTSSPSQEGTVDFGSVQINEKKTRKLSIINAGKYNFDFNCKLSKDCPGVCISPDFGSVGKGERRFCEISFTPSAPMSLRDVHVLVQINNGKRYKLYLAGTGRRPLLKFSQLEHDFGTQFVFTPGLTAAQHVFRVSNEDAHPICYEILQTESVSGFEVPKGLTMLEPGQKSEIEVTFYPKEAKSYAEEVNIEINGLSTASLKLKGQGSLVKIQTVSSEYQNINFGALKVGHSVTKFTKIVNRSTIPVTFTLGPQAVVEKLTACGIAFNYKEFTLRPKSIVSVDFKYQPPSRMPPFEYELQAESPGYCMPIVTVQGACLGIEILLESDSLPFGAIVHRSRTSRKIQLQNLGDIGVRYSWDPAQFLPDFFIAPSEGFVAAGTGVPLEITFHPKDINPDIRYENLACKIEGGPTLMLTLSGTCIPQPVSSDVRFTAPVRQSETKGIPITNKTTNIWSIHPMIENVYWTGAENFDIEPGQTKMYDITYSPMDMTKEDGSTRHEGSVFFPLPDGSGQLFKLIGNATPPAPAGTLTFDVPCKKSYNLTLPVANWLKKPQCFKVTFDLGKVEPSVVLKGNEFLEVPGLVIREYKLQAYIYKESIVNAKVTFKNETTQEYLFYNLVLKVGPPQVIASIDMTTPIRQAMTKDISLFNPLPLPTTFTAICSTQDLVYPHSFTVGPKSDGVCNLEYLPLIVPKDPSARLTITSPDLGTYLYELTLCATPPVPERPIMFKAGLGNACTMTFRFISYCKVKTEFLCKIDHADFSTERSVIAHPPASNAVGVPPSNAGVEVSVDIVYEPSHIGDVRTQLLVTSPFGGDYTCMLVGQCSPPRPQGPIFVKANAPTSLTFKNVFPATCTFNFTIDNAAFSVKSNETIPSKRSTTLSITYKGSAGAAKTGKLTVSTPVSNVTWTYYLKFNV